MIKLFVCVPSHPAPLPVVVNSSPANFLCAWLSTCLYISPDPITDLHHLLTVFQQPNLVVSNLTLKDQSFPMSYDRFFVVGFRGSPWNGSELTILNDTHATPAEQEHLLRYPPHLNQGRYAIALKTDSTAPRWYPLSNIQELTILQKEHSAPLKVPSVLTPTFDFANCFPVVIGAPVASVQQQAQYTAPLHTFFPCESPPPASMSLSLKINLDYFGDSSQDPAMVDYLVSYTFSMPTPAGTLFKMRCSASIGASNLSEILSAVALHFSEKRDHFLACYAQWHQLFVLTKQTGASIEPVETYMCKWEAAFSNPLTFQWRSTPSFRGNNLPSLSRNTTANSFSDLLNTIQQEELTAQRALFAC